MTVARRVTEFARLLSDAQTTGTEDRLFLRLMAPEAEHAFRLCVIPHQYDAEILRVLDPTLDAEQAERRCAEFADLAAVTPLADGWAVHDRWRRELFAAWLTADALEEFAAVSRRLVDFFARRAEALAGEANETANRRRMYHLIGADREAGLDEFERLCRRARSQLRYSECAAIIRMVHDYEPALSHDQQAIVAYHEAKLASDQRDWSAAEQRFRELAANAATPLAIRAKAYLRLGFVLASQARTEDAIQSYNTARALAETTPVAATIVPRIVHELGVVHRDAGDDAVAERLLTESATAAAAHEQWRTSAIAYNSLGAAYLRRNMAAEAIEAFKIALDQLARAKDALSESQVQNNIALSYAELADWPTSESWFTTSLEGKRRSGDITGQALVLNNLARVYMSQQRWDDVVTSGTEAVRLSEIAGDLKLAAVANQNLAKGYRRMGNLFLARTYYQQAIVTFERASESQASAAVRAELHTLDEKTGLPWWVWISIAIVGLVAAAVVVALLVSLLG